MLVRVLFASTFLYIFFFFEIEGIPPASLCKDAHRFFYLIKIHKSLTENIMIKMKPPS
jgi:hypothetical protein